MDICTSIASISFYFVSRLSRVRLSKECVVMDICISGINRIGGGMKCVNRYVQVTNFIIRYTSITSISFYFVARLSRVRSSKESVVVDICISGIIKIGGMKCFNRYLSSNQFYN